MKMKNKTLMGDNKAFTLIEVISVIVILSIIALISSPIIIGIVEESRIKTASVSAYGVIQAVRITILEGKIDKNRLPNGVYTINGETILKDGIEYTVNYRGTKIKDSTLTIENDEVVKACMKVNGFSMYYDGNDIINKKC